MQVSIILNGKKVTEDIAPDLLLLDFVYSSSLFFLAFFCPFSREGLIPVFSCLLPPFVLVIIDIYTVCYSPSKRSNATKEISWRISGIV